MDIRCKIDSNGNKYWYGGEEEYQENNLLFIEFKNGNKHWYMNGKLHRDDRPAIEYADGSKVWYKDGKEHRYGDLPAMEFANGDKHWYRDGERHRDGILPAIEYMHYGQRWYKHGRRYWRIDVENAYRILQNQCRRFRGYLWRKKLHYKSSIHKELLCRPARGNFPGGLHYQEMVASL